MNITVKEKAILTDRLNSLPDRHRMFKRIATATGYNPHTIRQCRVPSQKVSRKLYDTIINYLNSMSSVKMVEQPRPEKTVTIERHRFSKVIINFTEGTVEIIK